MSWRTKGFVLLGVLVASELIGRLLYYIFANRMDDLCFEHNDKATTAAEICSHVSLAASHAFSSSTILHLPIILVSIALFFSLTSRLDKLEAEIATLRKDIDA